MTTETMDKLYLEYSQITKARTARELSMLTLLNRIRSFARQNDTMASIMIIQMINGEIGNDK